MKLAGMKQSDVAMLIIVVVIAMTMSYLIGNALLNKPNSRMVEVEVVQPISDQFSTPDPMVFVDDYINPTELINISNSNNSKPFGNGTN